MNNGLWQVGALNGEGKHLRTKASYISGNMWCTHLVFGSEDKQHKDGTEHGRWLHLGTCTSHCSSPLLSVARECGVIIMLTVATGWFGTQYLLFRRCQTPCEWSQSWRFCLYELFCWGLWWHIHFFPCLFTYSYCNYLMTIEFKLGNVTDWKVIAPKDISF